MSKSMAELLKGPRDYKNLRISESGKLVVDQKAFVRDENVRKTVEALRTVRPESNPARK